MKFALIDPRTCAFRVPIEAESLHDAERLLGMDPDHTDHGVVYRGRDGGVALVVYEYGFFMPPEEQHYFSLGMRLYAGPAVLYAFDDHGASVDIKVGDVPPVVFYPSADKVEAAIQRGEIERPRMISATPGGPSIVLWEWPGGPPDDGMKKSMQASPRPGPPKQEAP